MKPVFDTNFRMQREVTSEASQLASTAYMLGRGHTCHKCEASNVPCNDLSPKDDTQRI